MPTNYLPKVKDENRLQKLTRHGEWIGEEDPSKIDDLANALDVPAPAESGKKLDKDEIYSIPDPWARMILFTRALLDETHPAHRKIVGEWRGLLAILALKEIRRFSELVAAGVSLDFNKPGAARPPKDSFLAMAARVKPGAKDLIARGTTWSTFHILSWRSRGGGGPRAFAITCPTTLVATGAYYAETMNSEEVPWFRQPEFAPPPPPKPGKVTHKVLLRGGVLRSPTAEDLSDDERVALAQWLQQVYTGLAGEGKGYAHAQVMKRLQSFQKDMLKGLDIGDIDTQEERVLSEKRIGLTTKASDIYALIDRPAKFEPALLTDLMLVTPRGEQKYILFDADAATGLRRDAKDIAFYKGVSLASAARHYPDGVASGLIDDEAALFYCTKDFFFQSDLVFILKGGKQADMIPGCRKANIDPDSHACSQQRQILFPLTETAARLYTPEELARRCTVKWLNGDEAVVSFVVDVKAHANPAAGGRQAEAMPRKVLLQKTYRGDALHAVTTVPVLGVWPNIQFSDGAGVKPMAGSTAPTSRWQRYFLFQSWRGGANRVDKLVLRARPLDERDPVERMVKQGEYFQISRIARFPDVLVCRMPREVEQQNRPDFVLGLLLPTLLEENKLSIAATKNAVLGVDFGTTGTSIYQSFFAGDGIGGQTEGAEPVQLHDRFGKITASSDEELLNLTRELFLPAKTWSAAKILSVYQDLESSEASDKSGSPRFPITHGHVLFADEKDQHSYIPDKQKDSVHSDLKWGQKQIVAKAAKDFISQLCLQSVLELVVQGAKTVEVRYSYPTAFNDSDVYAFVQRWGSIIKEVDEATSVEVREGKNIEQNYEAVAAARYFRDKENLTAEGGAMTLDIGGGTTDLALWSTVKNKPTLLSHSSVLFAGRDIFLATIREHPELLECIRNPNRSPAPVPEFKEGGEIKKGTPAFHALVDAHIQMYGDKLMTDTGDRFSKDNPLLTEFLRIIELGLCGIAFYSGLHWGRMIAGHRPAVVVTSNGQAPDPTLQAELEALQTASRIRVYVGGNGSKLLRWCGHGRFEERAPIYKAFAASLQAGVDVAAPGFPPKRVEIKLSEEPKQEVAYGLVKSGPDSQKGVGFTVPMAGESFILEDGTQRSWSDPLDLSSLRAGAVRVGDKRRMMAPGEERTEGRLPVFSAFLAAVEERPGKDQLEDISLDVNQLLNEKHSDLAKTMANTDDEKEVDNKVRNEPIFFLALKHLIKKKIDAVQSASVKV